MSCDREDVIKIAKDLHMRPTEKDIQYVIEHFDNEAEIDPTGDWTLWIENLLISHLDLEQFPPPKKYQYFLFDETTGEVELDLGMLTHSEADNYESNSLKAITAHQLMVEQALIEIQKDVRDGDLTAIEGLLQVIPERYLKDFLPEKL